MAPKHRHDPSTQDPARPRRPSRSPHSNACPRFFRELVREARTGEASFTECGFELGRRIFSLVGEELGPEVLGELVVSIVKHDQAAILQWLQRRVPRMMALVPPRQYAQFLAGFLQATEKEMTPVDRPLAA